MQSQNFYQDVVDIIQQHFRAYAIQIWILNDAHETRNESPIWGLSPHLKIGHTFAESSGGIMYRVIRNRETYIANDVSQDPNFRIFLYQSNTC